MLRLLHLLLGVYCAAAVPIQLARERSEGSKLGIQHFSAGGLQTQEGTDNVGAICVQVSIPLLEGGLNLEGGIMGELHYDGDTKTLSGGIELSVGVSAEAYVARVSFYASGKLSFNVEFHEAPASPYDGLVEILKKNLGWSLFRGHKLSKNIQGVMSLRDEPGELTAENLGITDADDFAPNVDYMKPPEDAQSALRLRAYMAKHAKFVNCLFKNGLVGEDRFWINIEWCWRVGFLTGPGQEEPTRDDLKNTGTNPKCRASADAALDVVSIFLCTMFTTGALNGDDSVDSWLKPFKQRNYKRFVSSLQFFYHEFSGMKPQDMADMFIDEGDDDAARPLKTAMKYYLAFSMSDEKLEKWLVKERGAEVQAYTLKSFTFDGTMGITLGGDRVGFCTPDSNIFQIQWAWTFNWLPGQGWKQDGNRQRIITISVGGILKVEFVEKTNSKDTRNDRMIMQMRFPTSAETELNLEGVSISPPGPAPEGTAADIFAFRGAWLSEIVTQLFVDIPSAAPLLESITDGAGIKTGLQNLAASVGQKVGSLFPTGDSMTGSYKSALQVGFNFGTEYNVGERENICSLQGVTSTQVGADVKFPGVVGVQAYLTNELVKTVFNHNFAWEEY